MSHWYKNEPTDFVWWLDNPDVIGEFVFSFDRRKQFNLFQDFPFKLTAAQRRIFERENPFWAEFFEDRK